MNVKSWIWILVLLLCCSGAAAHDFGGTTNPDTPEIDDEPEDDPCKQMCCTNGGGAGKPVMLLDGGENYLVTDLTLGINYPIALQRKYDSQATYDSPLGYGWAFLHDRRIFEYPDGSVTLRRGCGTRAHFEPAGGAFVTPRDSVQGTLTRFADGSYDFRYYNGFVDRFDAEGRLIGAENREGWQNEFLYDARGKLPLVGTSKFAVNPDQPTTVAYVYRVTRIQQRSPDGALTGFFVDFEYNEATGRLIRATTSDGRVAEYEHDVFAGLTRGNLTRVHGLDNLSMTYDYQDPNDPHNLTHIQDADTAAPVVNTYDAQDRVTTQVQGASELNFAYPQPRAVSTVTRLIKDNLGNLLHTAVTTYEFDEAGYLAKVIDAEGNETRHFYDANKNRERTELWQNGATGLTLLKTTAWTYVPDGNVASETVMLDSGEILTRTWTYDSGWVSSQQSVSSAAPKKIFRTEYSFIRDAQGVPLRISEVKQIGASGTTRVTTTEYCSTTEIGQPGSECPFEGLVKAIDGPRTDVADITTFSYYTATDISGCGLADGPCHQRGQLRATTNALDQTTEFLRYNLAGDVLRSRDANGLVTDFEYHSRRWLTATKVRGDDPATEADDLITRQDYDAAGNLLRRTAPDGSFVAFTYDARHRLSGINDNLGNQIDYSLDSEGNRLKEENFDPAGALKRTLSRGFDALNRLAAQLTAAGEATVFDYDAAGNLTAQQDPIPGLNPALNQYDDRDRLIQTADPTGGITQYAYDANDNLVQVTDPLGHATQYTYNALGDLLQLDSPDTGTTTYTYDEAGNRWTQTDARGVVAEFTYDALNRLTDINYPSDPTLNVTYTYDQGPNGIGRMTDMADASGSTAWTYDAQGRVTSKTQTVATAVLTVQYQYDAGGRLSGVIYPDGTVLGYGYDPAGRLATALAAPGGGTGQSVIDGVDYLPFGPVSRLNFAVFPDQDRTYDLDYRPQALSGPLARTYGTDPAGNITGITQGADAWNFEYDDLYRLETVTDPKGAIVESFAYDSNGNRTSHDGEIYQTDLTSNRLAQRGAIAYQYDAMGNTTGTIGDAAGDVSLFYGAHQRLLNSARDQWQGSYRYNGRGERVRKDWFFGRGVSQVRVFLYDESGRLLGEYAEDGTPVAQYLWLGNMPIGVIQSGQVYAIHTDHLTTPRAVINSQGTTVWRWESLDQPFGESLPDTDPDGNGGTFTMNLRFPGQYFDAETGQNYNYFRYYGQAIGRYLTADPIGIVPVKKTTLPNLNDLYVYVSNNPVNLTDQFGLFLFQFIHPRFFGPVCGTGFSAFFIPDGPFENACRKHDECYATCGKTKERCDLELCTNGACLYGFLLDGPLTRPSKNAYDKAQKESGCDDCNQ